MVSAFVSVCAKLLLVNRSSARLLWSKKMSLGLSWLASLLPKVSSLRAKAVAVSVADLGPVSMLATQLPGSVQLAALAGPACETEPAGFFRACAGILSWLRHRMKTSWVRHQQQLGGAVDGNSGWNRVRSVYTLVLTPVPTSVAARYREPIPGHVRASERVQPPSFCQKLLSRTGS